MTAKGVNGRGTIFVSSMNGDHHQWVELTHYGNRYEGQTQSQNTQVAECSVSHGTRSLYSRPAYGAGFTIP